MTKGPEGLSIEEQMLVPIHQYMRQLQQQATQAEWDGDLDRCDLLLHELKHARDYHNQTGSLYFPLF